MTNVLLGLDRPSPRLPPRSLPAWRTGLAAVVVHMAVGGALFVTAVAPVHESTLSRASTPKAPNSIPRMVFLAQHGPSSGGGGGGNRRAGVIRRAQAPGVDALTLPIATSRSLSERETPVPKQELLLAARPLASGTSYVAGLPDMSAPLTGDALGPGSGGGVGEGEGRGIGSGRGSGVGPGLGGGSGGGAYRAYHAGGSVSAPVLLTQVRPSYTDAALRFRVQGSVVLELVVNPNGCPEQIRVTQPLDPGLDAEAIKAVEQWRFHPGRIDGTPVPVLVSVIVDFRVH